MGVINIGEVEFRYLQHPFFWRRAVDPERDEGRGILGI